MYNEVADQLAKKGTKMPIKEQEPVVPVPNCQKNMDIDTEVRKRWNIRWHNEKTARQTRLFWTDVDAQKSANMTKLGRNEYGDHVRLLSGHNHLNRHAYLLNEVQSEECRLCLESEESSEHILCECPALGGTRNSVTGSYMLTAEAVSNLPFKSLRHLTSLICARLKNEGLEYI